MHNEWTTLRDALITEFKTQTPLEDLLGRLYRTPFKAATAAIAAAATTAATTAAAAIAAAATVAAVTAAVAAAAEAAAAAAATAAEAVPTEKSRRQMQISKLNLQRNINKILNFEDGNLVAECKARNLNIGQGSSLLQGTSKWHLRPADSFRGCCTLLHTPGSPGSSDDC
ncbi:uncharacterized protein LOC122756572 [Drosophila santomea]|uniref:uncharacterized protein LOC122756572 n=1 Tax=Drosophila santomea TaxID=129105 RepID=UPI001CCE499E|nr:uncharacterized protein LOC122756572 [Drosophila santomea]